MATNAPEITRADIETKPQHDIVDEADLERAVSGASAASMGLDPKYDAMIQNQERRKKVEKRLKWKLDLRCSLFILIYIMSE